MIDALKQNIDTEIEVLREISNNLRRLDYANPSERKLLMASIESLRASLKVINNSTPSLLDEITIVKKLPQKESLTNLQKVEFKGIGPPIEVTVQREDREEILRELSISDSLLRKIKKGTTSVPEKFDEVQAPRGYIKLSNVLFLNQAKRLIEKGYFKPLSVQIKRANIQVLFAAYIAIMLLTTAIACILSLILMIALIFLDVSLTTPFITAASGGDLYYYLARLTRVFWIPIALPALTFLFLYYYPSTEKDSLAKRIDEELPFAVIHMSAISGSGIEPSEIFKIIALSKEYPYLRKEIRKIINQINIYGYDLITALNNVSKITPSSKTSELFSGLAQTITSGGSLQDYLEERSKTLLVAYRLEREQYTKVAETFMDIYISIVLAAPMILIIMLILISISSIDTGFTIQEMAFIIVFIIALINVVLLTFLHIKQPHY